MSRIKSFEELQKIRENVLNRVDVRKTGDNPEKIILAVGMATCGIASGARKTLNTLIDELNNHKINNVAVIQTGCLGYCYAEPIVEVRIPNQESIIYGDVDESRAREIIKRHVIDGELLDNAIIGKGFDKI